MAQANETSLKVHPAFVKEDCEGILCSERCRHFRFKARLVQSKVAIYARYIERANPSGEVGRLGKRSTDLCAFTECVDLYVAIGEEVCFIDMV
jgi:hypothetical protein